MKASTLKEVDALSSSQTGVGMLFGWQFFLPRYIKPSGYLKAFFSCLTAVSVASPLSCGDGAVPLPTLQGAFAIPDRHFCCHPKPAMELVLHSTFLQPMGDGIGLPKKRLHSYVMHLNALACYSSQAVFQVNISWRTDSVIPHYQQREQTTWILV